MGDGDAVRTALLNIPMFRLGVQADATLDGARFAHGCQCLCGTLERMDLHSTPSGCLPQNSCCSSLQTHTMTSS